MIARFKQLAGLVLALSVGSFAACSKDSSSGPQPLPAPAGVEQESTPADKS